MILKYCISSLEVKTQLPTRFDFKTYLQTSKFSSDLVFPLTILKLPFVFHLAVFRSLQS